MVLLLLGPPGCGKGTQARRIARLLQIPVISAEDLVPAEMAVRDQTGRGAPDAVASGSLAEDELINTMLVHRLNQPDCRDGFLLDGYPRTVAQAVFLDGFLAGHGWPPPIAILIEAPEEVIVTRVTSRRTCPGCGRVYNLCCEPPRIEGFCDDCGQRLIIRDSDREDVIRERLRTYRAEIAPVAEYYRDGAFYAVDGALSPPDVFRGIMAALTSELAVARL